MNKLKHWFWYILMGKTQIDKGTDTETDRGTDTQTDGLYRDRETERQADRSWRGTDAERWGCRGTETQGKVVYRQRWCGTVK